MDENIIKEEPKEQNEASSFAKASEDKLQELKKQSEEYLNNWKRAAADLANYKKGEVERVGLLSEYVRESVIDNILPVLDSIHLAQQHMPDEVKNSSWMQGFSQIQNQIKDFLKKEGIGEIETVGQKFDPATMEIVGEVEGSEPGVVVEELQKGYIINGKVIRPPKVKINK